MSLGQELDVSRTVYDVSHHGSFTTIYSIQEGKT